MRYMGYAALAVAMVVLHYYSPAVDEAVGGSWWWWLLVAVVIVYLIRSDLRSSRKPSENPPSPLR
jgi:hypothetical protein